MSSAAREVEYCYSHVPPMIEPMNDSKVTHSRVDRVAQQLNGRISSNQSSLSSGEALGFGGGVCGAISRRLARDEGGPIYKNVPNIHYNSHFFPAVSAITTP